MTRILRSRSTTSTALLATTLLFAAPALRLHAQVVGGTIAGAITDASGAAIPNAQVTVHNDETGSERRLASGPDGHYSAPSVPVGTYTISVHAEGFADEKRQNLKLSVGQSELVNITLPVQGASETVVVEDKPPVINLSTQQTAGLVDSREVKELPLNGRSYDQLVTLNPGMVNYTAQRSGSVGTSNSSVGNMFAVSGRRPQDNLYLLNGVEYTGASLINVTPGGTSGQLLGVEAVREFNVIADTYSAAYGKRQGGQVSIVTASGTNTLHGSVYEFLRNSALDARNYFDKYPTSSGKRIPEFQRNNFGASLGGPIRHDKVFLFGNYEGYRQNLGLSDVTLVPDNSARQGFLPDPANPSVLKNYGLAPGVAPLMNLWPVQNGPELLDAKGNPTGIAYSFSSPMQHIREDFGTTRVDVNFSSKDQGFATYTVDDSIAHTPTQNPLTLIDEATRNQVITAQEQHVFSPALLNTARFGFSRAYFFFNGSVPVQGVTPFVVGKPVGAIVIAGSTASNGASQITTAGANVGSNNRAVRNLFTFDDHVYYTRGKHQLEAGFWLQRLQANDNLAQFQYGQASFSTLTSFLQGTVATFSVVPAPTELGWRALFTAAYIEDTIRFTPSLEVRAGVRIESSNGWNEAQGRAANYDFTPGAPGQPAIINTNPTIGNSALTVNRAKFLPEPRVGLSYSPFGANRTAIRASFGMHHALLDNLDYRLSQVAPFNTTIALRNLPVSSISIAPGTTGLSGGQISPSNVQRDIHTPTVLSWTLRIEQQILPNTSLTVGYVGSHGYHQILSEDMNEPIAVTCPAAACPASLPAGTIYYPTTNKVNPNVANTTSWVSQGSSSYHALQVDLRRTLTHGLAFRANYTYARNLDNGSAWNTSVSANTPAFVSYPYNPSLDWGPAATDLRHVATFNTSYDLPFGTGKALLGSAGHLTDRIVGGWTLSGIASVQSGFPFTPQLGYNPTGSGDTRNPVRPNWNRSFSGPLYTQGTTAQRAAQYFNPAAFSAPAYGTLGNVSRNALVGPGYSDIDISLTKNTQITERVRAQFRAEAFNVINHTNLQTPTTTVFTSGPAQGTTANQTTPAAINPTAGVITSAATSRQIQLGVKILF